MGSGNGRVAHGELILLQISIINSGKNIKKNYLKVMNSHQRQKETKRHLIFDLKKKKERNHQGEIYDDKASF